MIIYMTINNINGKKYIGKDVKNNPKYLGSGFDLQKAIKKYGKENLTDYREGYDEASILKEYEKLKR